jgi:hypothetical protein
MKSIRLTQVRLKTHIFILGKTSNTLGQEEGRGRTSLVYLPDDEVIVATRANGKYPVCEIVPLYNIASMTPENIEDLGYPSDAFKPPKIEAPTPITPIVKEGTLPQIIKEEARDPVTFPAIERTGPKHVKPEKLFPMPEITLGAKPEEEEGEEEAKKEAKKEEKGLEKENKPKKTKTKKKGKKDE